MIDINLNKYDDAFSKFNDLLMSVDLENYITSQANKIMKNVISINIKGNFTKSEQEKLVLLIKNTFDKKRKFYSYIEKYDNLFRVVLIFLGSILILVSNDFNFLLNEIFLIAGWILIWEAFYDILFENLKRKRKNIIYKKLATCKINFIERK